MHIHVGELGKHVLCCVLRNFSYANAVLVEMCDADMKNCNKYWYYETEELGNL